MSRHEIEAKDPKKHRIFIGWDRPLSTFFGQVYDKEVQPLDEGDLLLWVGADGKCLTLMSVEAALQPYAKPLPSQFREKLLKEMEEDS